METMMKLLSALDAADDGDNDDVVVSAGDGLQWRR